MSDNFSRDHFRNRHYIVADPINQGKIFTPAGKGEGGEKKKSDFKKQ
jgi:hypothetical protein